MEDESQNYDAPTPQGRSSPAPDGGDSDEALTDTSLLSDEETEEFMKPFDEISRTQTGPEVAGGRATRSETRAVMEEGPADSADRA